MNKQQNNIFHPPVFCEIPCVFCRVVPAVEREGVRERSSIKALEKLLVVSHPHDVGSSSSLAAFYSLEHPDVQIISNTFFTLLVLLAYPIAYRTNQSLCSRDPYVRSVSLVFQPCIFGIRVVKICVPASNDKTKLQINIKHQYFQCSFLKKEF